MSGSGYHGTDFTDMTAPTDLPAGRSRAMSDDFETVRAPFVKGDPGWNALDRIEARLSTTEEREAKAVELLLGYYPNWRSRGADSALDRDVREFLEARNALQPEH